MKKILYMITLLLLICNLTGCKGQTLADYGDTSKYNTPNITAVRSSVAGDGYNYIIDNNTGVVYLEWHSGYGAGITVMFNADGTVMTEKDIKKE